MIFPGALRELVEQLQTERFRIHAEFGTESGKELGQEQALVQHSEEQLRNKA